MKRIVIFLYNVRFYVLTKICILKISQFLNMYVKNNETCIFKKKQHIDCVYDIICSRVVRI